MNHKIIDDFRDALTQKVEAFERSVETKSRFRFLYPLGTSEVGLILSHLGYDDSRANLDHCTRFAKRIGYKAPTARRGVLAWTRENVIDFAMQLERMRAWLPGRHNERKTVFEIAAQEVEHQEFLASWDALVDLPASPLLDAAAGAHWPETVAIRRLAASLFLMRKDTAGESIKPRLRAALVALSENRESAKLRTLLAKLRAELRKVKH